MYKFGVAISIIATEAYGLGRTMADCLAVAAKFDNTCDVTANTPLTTFSSHAGSIMSCTGTMRCPGGTTKAIYTTASPCTWKRKLCVTCATDAATGLVKIRVQSNGLPNHCFDGGATNPAAVD